MNVAVPVVLDTRLRGYDVSRIAELRDKAENFKELDPLYWEYFHYFFYGSMLSLALYYPRILE